MLKQDYDSKNPNAMVFLNDPALLIFTRNENGKLDPVNKSAKKYAYDQLKEKFLEIISNIMIENKTFFKDMNSANGSKLEDISFPGKMFNLVNMLKDKPKAMRLSVDIGLFIAQNNFKNEKEILKNPNLKSDIKLLGYSINNKVDLIKEPKGNYGCHE